MLRLREEAVPEGFGERRVYRVLFAGEPDAEGWGHGGDAGQRQADGDRFEWRLHRVGGGMAWALDGTVLLAGADDSAAGVLLRELTGDARRRGLIPVTTERFA